MCLGDRGHHIEIWKDISEIYLEPAHMLCKDCISAYTHTLSFIDVLKGALRKATILPFNSILCDHFRRSPSGNGIREVYCGCGLSVAPREPVRCL